MRCRPRDKAGIRVIDAAADRYVPEVLCLAACIIHRATAALMGERTSWSSQRRSEAVAR